MYLSWKILCDPDTTFLVILAVKLYLYFRTKERITTRITINPYGEKGMLLNGHIIISPDYCYKHQINSENPLPSVSLSEFISLI